MVNIINFIKGFVIGSLMLIPGISGGTSAIILNIYNPIIEAIGNLNNKFFKSVKYLLPIALGGLLGVAVMARIVLLIYEVSPYYFSFFVIGLILGGIPLLVPIKEVKLDFKRICSFILGLGICVTIMFLPENLFIVNKNLSGYFMIVILGFVLAIALVLPGISFSYMLVVLGIYKYLLEAINNIDILFLSTLGFSILLGVFLVSKALNHLLVKYQMLMNYFITGFLVFSLYLVYPSFYHWYQLFLGICLVTIGFLSIFLINKVIKRNDDKIMN